MPDTGEISYEDVMNALKVTRTYIDQAKDKGIDINKASELFKLARPALQNNQLEIAMDHAKKAQKEIVMESLQDTWSKILRAKEDGMDAIRAWFAERRDGLVDPSTGQRFDDLDAACRDDLLRFEGNAQTLRLVARLQALADYHGLNLTVGTLSALAKYTARSDEARRDHPDHARSKPGHFASEADLVARIRALAGTGVVRNPITFLVEAADDIVYSVIDLEDGVRKGVLDWAALRDGLRDASGGDALVEACLGAAEPVKAILDTDIGSDCDDVDDCTADGCARPPIAMPRIWSAPMPRPPMAIPPR